MSKYAKRVGGRVVAAQRKRWLIVLIFVIVLVLLYGMVSWLLF